MKVEPLRKPEPKPVWLLHPENSPKPDRRVDELYEMKNALAWREARSIR